MIAVIGLIMFAVSSYLALSKKMHLMVPFVVVPVIAGLFCGFSLPEVLNFAAEGVSGTFNSVLLCIFAVLYFSVLSETGMFDIMVNRLVGITRGNIYIVMVVTVLVAFIGHLDGAYNTTYLIAIPALAPLYKRLNIDRRSLVLLVSLAAAPMTAMAWGQLAKMTVFDPSIDPVVMASSLYPVVAIMLGLAVVTSLGFGYHYSKKNASEIALLRKSFENGGGSQNVDFSNNPLARPKLFLGQFCPVSGIAGLLYVYDQCKNVCAVHGILVCGAASQLPYPEGAEPDHPQAFGHYAGSGNPVPGDRHHGGDPQRDGNGNCHGGRGSWHRPGINGKMDPCFICDPDPASGDLHPIPGFPEHESPAFGDWSRLRADRLPGADVYEYFLFKSMFPAGGCRKSGLRVGRGGYHQTGEVFCPVLSGL